MKIVVLTAVQYPMYRKETEFFTDVETATERMKELEKELMGKCKAKELCDYQIEIRV